jgi:hypothetical protein
VTRTNFLGIPVDGDIIPGDRVPQRPLADLQPLLRALLDDEAIGEFGWRQYTPYFNDGEPCVFEIQDFWVRTSRESDDADPGELGVGEYWGPHPSLGDMVQGPDGGYSYQGDDQPRYERARALADALGSGAFDDVLLDAFGDHAGVKVRRSGIQVEFYQHD